MCSRGSLSQQSQLLEPSPALARAELQHGTVSPCLGEELVCSELTASAEAKIESVKGSCSPGCELGLQLTGQREQPPSLPLTCEEVTLSSQRSRGLRSLETPQSAVRTDGLIIGTGTAFLKLFTINLLSFQNLQSYRHVPAFVFVMCFLSHIVPAHQYWITRLSTKKELGREYSQSLNTSSAHPDVCTQPVQNHFHS